MNEGRLSPACQVSTVLEDLKETLKFAQPIQFPIYTGLVDLKKPC